MKKLVFQILLVLAVGLAANAVMGLFWADVGQVIDQGQRAALSIALGFAAYFVGMYLIETLRLSLVLQAYRVSLAFTEMFLNSVMGYFYSSITPMAAGGQPFQILHLKAHGVQPSLASNIYINRYVEHLVFSVTVILLSLGFAFGLLHRMQTGTGTGALVAAMVLSLSLAVLVSIGLLRPAVLSGFFRLLGRFQRLRSWSSRAVDFLSNVQGAIVKSWNHHIGLMLTDTVLGICNTVLQAASLWLTLLLLGQNLDFPTVFLAYMMLNLLIFYIPTPGASGGIEGVYSLAFGTLTRDFSTSWSAVLLWRIGTFYLHVPLGLILLLSASSTRKFLLGRT